MAGRFVEPLDTVGEVSGGVGRRDAVRGTIRKRSGLLLVSKRFRRAFDEDQVSVCPRTYVATREEGVDTG